MNIKYREAQNNDYEELKRLYMNIFGFEMSKKNYEAYLEDEKNTILLAMCGEEYCGSICVENRWDAFRGESSFFLKNGGVYKKWRQHGIYTELIKIIRKMAEIENIKVIELTCADYREETQKYYLNHGFEKKKTTVFICEIE